MDDFKPLGYLLSDAAKCNPPPTENTPETCGDGALLEHNYAKGIEHYLSVKEGGLRVAEKLAWCHYGLGQWSEVIAKLAPFPERDLSGYAQTILTIALMDGWSGSYSVSDALKQRAKAILDRLLENGHEFWLTYYARCSLFFDDNDRAVQAVIALKAFQKFPKAFYYRFRAVELRRFNGISDTEGLAYLRDGLDLEVVDESYLWLTSSLAKGAQDYALSLDCIEQLTLRVSTDEALAEDYRPLLGHALAMARAEVRTKQGRFAEAQSLYEPITQRPWETRYGAYPDGLAVEAYCRLIELSILSEALPDLPSLVHRLMVYLGETPESLIKATSVLDGFLGPFRFPNDDLFALDIAQLSHYVPQLAAMLSGEDLGLMLWFLAMRNDNQEADSEESAQQVIQAAGYLRHPALEGLLVEAYLLQKPIPWRLVGESWARYRLHAYAELNEEGEGWGDPLERLKKPSKKAITDYFSGVVSVLTDENRSIVGARHLLSGVLRDALLEKELHDKFLKIARELFRIDSCTGTRFDLALGEHWVGDAAIAETHYWQVIADDRIHFSAIFNLCLIYKQAPSVEKVERLTAHVAEVSQDSFTSEKWQRLEAALEAAQQALRPDPNTLNRDAIAIKMATYATLVDEYPLPQEISLTDAVSLLCLLKTSPSISRDYVLEAFDQNVLPFAPTSRFRQYLFGLLDEGYVAIDSSTPTSAFSAQDGKVSGYFLGRIRWRCSEDTLRFAQAIEQFARARQWPDAWLEELPRLSLELAVDECIVYLNHLAEERRFPDPDMEKARLMFEGMLSDFSVSQCYYFIYLAALSASDYKQKYPVNAEQAANMMLLRCQEKVDRARQEEWSVRKFDRSRDVPRSAASYILHDMFTGWGEDAFREVISKISPSQEAVE
jgi:hypothetical protein